MEDAPESRRACALCGGALAAEHLVREMMLGLGERFRYGECGECSSLTLLDVPEQLGRYYPPDYYSLRPQPRSGHARRIAKRVRAELAVRGHDRLARLVGLGAPPPGWVRWLELAGLDRRASICDIGCGAGDPLLDLRDQGFADLTGADAFIERSLDREGIRIHKVTPSELKGSWDLLMLNHSFEHMPDPAGTLGALRRLLRPGGTLLLRVPIAGSWAWRNYGTDWVAIDAPRHLFVPSEAGLRALAGRAGWEVYELVYDSTAMQFWCSEQYRAGIPLFSARSYQVNPSASPFTRRQLRAWRRRAEQLNRAGDGDAAAAFLRPI